MVPEQGDRDELGEEARLASLDHVPQPPGGAPGRRSELDRPHQPQPANLAHDLEALDQRTSELEQQLAEAGRPIGQLLALDHIERREGGGRGQIASAERRAVHHAALHRVERRLEHAPARKQRPDRDVPARQRF